MTSGRNIFRRDLFEIENARNLTPDQLVRTFVPTKAFWRLLSAKNHIVLGARGSGKTALAKMLSHDHLSRLKEPRAQKAIKSKAFIGIYVSTSLEWVGGLKNKPWQSEKDAEESFQWLLNISTCLAFLNTLRSCLDTYLTDKGEIARVEEKLAYQIGQAWSEKRDSFSTIRELRYYLEDVGYMKQQQSTRKRVAGKLQDNEDIAGICFETELFTPLRRAISLASRELNIPSESSWLLCLDEAEFLEPMHHRIINSHLRASSGNLFFKITTMPYVHHTIDTNTRVPLAVGHDFEYVYIDQDPVIWAGKRGEEGSTFATMLFNKRAKISRKRYRNVTLPDLLGHSELLDPKQSQWGPESDNMALLKKYGSEDTLRRAKSLYNYPKRFSDEIARKIHGALLLRHAIQSQKGHEEIDVYSGMAMIIRCGDANPRRLISIFNNLLMEVQWPRQNGLRKICLPPKIQTKVLIAFSTSTLTRIQAEEQCGLQLYKLIKDIGEYMRISLHKEPLSTDQVSSIIVDTTISDEQWNLIKSAVGLGLLYPNISTSNPDQMPERHGIFRLAYVLAPHFRILPRRGRARKLSSILNYMEYKSSEPMKVQMPLFQLDQGGGSQ
jgi:hypothetical protein